jgi:hypothetical protein
MKVVLFILLIISAIKINANEAKKVIIVNQKDLQPISYAIISFYETDTLVGGIYANVDGIFSLKLAEKINSLKFSCVGYKTKCCPISSNFPDTIMLEPVNYNIQEIVVNPKTGSNTIELGYIKKSSLKAYGSSRKNTEFAVFIPNKTGKNAMIKTLLYKLRQDSDVKTALRVHIYSIAENGFVPGKELIPINKVLYLEGKHPMSKVVSFDVSDLGIVLPVEGIFVGLEWIGLVNENEMYKKGSIENIPYILTTNLIDEKVSFTKGYFTKDMWKIFDSQSKDKGEKNQNFAFGLEAIEY